MSREPAFYRITHRPEKRRIVFNSKVTRAFFQIPFLFLDEDLGNIGRKDRVDQVLLLFLLLH